LRPERALEPDLGLLTSDAEVIDSLTTSTSAVNAAVTAPMIASAETYAAIISPMEVPAPLFARAASSVASASS
jgi:hypothetical protein